MTCKIGFGQLHHRCVFGPAMASRCCFESQVPVFSKAVPESEAARCLCSTILLLMIGNTSAYVSGALGAETLVSRFGSGKSTALLEDDLCAPTRNLPECSLVPASFFRVPVNLVPSHSTTPAGNCCLTFFFMWQYANAWRMGPKVDICCAGTPAHQVASAVLCHTGFKGLGGCGSLWRVLRV